MWGVNARPCVNVGGVVDRQISNLHERADRLKLFYLGASDTTNSRSGVHMPKGRSSVPGHAVMKFRLASRQLNRIP
jgi:hypothetical protein